MSTFWNNFFNGPHTTQNDPLAESNTPTSRTTTAASLTDRAARLRKVVGGTAKPKLIDEVNDLGTAMGYSFTSTGLPNMLTELGLVVLGIKSSGGSAASSGVSTIVDGIKKMREDIGLPASSGSTEESLKELETSIFGSSKDGPFLDRVVALRKEIYGSP